MAKIKAIQILMVIFILTGTFAMAIAASVSIYADKEAVVECETVTLTVTGPIDHTITVSSCDPDHTIFPGGATDNPDIDTSSSFDDIITEEQTMKQYTVYFTGAGEHRIKLVDTLNSTEDYVDITVVEKQLLYFDAPLTCAIGDLLLIEGTVNAGNTIDIAIDDMVLPELNDISIDSYFDFGVELDTSEIDMLKNIDSYRLKGYIDRERGVGEVGGDEENDGSLTIRMISDNLDVEVSKYELETRDTFVISGTALGSKEVEILIISPKGSNLHGIESESPISDCPGINYYTATVARQTDDTFSKTVQIDETACEGFYVILVFSSGCDGGYGVKDSDISSLTEVLAQYDIRGKTQSQFMEIVEDATVSAVRSDDLLFACTVHIENPYSTLELDTITDVYSLGMPLTITGTTDREDDTTIWITIIGPSAFQPKSARVEDGRFSATFDTTDAVEGTYSFEADDGYGNTDTVTVTIGAAPAPTAAPTATPTATPTTTLTPSVPRPAAVPTTTPIPVATHAPTPMPTGTKTPKEPGFEVAFAITVLLVVAYFVGRRK